MQNIPFKHSNTIKQFWLKCLISILCSIGFISVKSYADNKHVQAELLSEVTSIKPGSSFWIGVHLKMEPEWNTYWLNPGEVGLATEVKWQLPEGFTVGSLNWPYPTKVEMDGIVGYGYEGETILLAQVKAPQGLDIKGSVKIKAHVEWLECNDLCLPGSTDIEVELSVLEQEPQLNEKNHKLFEEIREKLPYLSNDWEIRAYLTETELDFIIEKAPNSKLRLPASVTFFSYVDDVNPGSTQKLEPYREGLLLRLHKNEYFSTDIESVQGVLFSEQGWDADGTYKALGVNLYIQEDALPPMPSMLQEDAVQPKKEGDPDEGNINKDIDILSKEQETQTKGLGAALVFAFIGGLILNLMPCVFPVLGLKVLSFVSHAKESKKVIRAHGAIFTIGILLSFWMLSGLLMVLRATGEELGWGFQLQSPGFVAFLIILLFVMGLNFAGVFEIGESMIGIGSKLSQRQGYIGSFFSGVVATLVATPCTAPFMGSALAFALSHPPQVAFMIFTMLALGMAFPYIALSFNPNLLKFLPRPGEWMETFKIIMAFPLFATVIWLSWVFSLQVGHNAHAELMFALLIIALGTWIYSRFSAHSRSKSSKMTARFICIACFGLGITLAYDAKNNEMDDPRIIVSSDASNSLNTPSAASSEITWMPYSSELIEKLRAQNQPIYLDFTAAWCLTCQANKKALFNSEEVVKRLKELNFAMVRADWTRRDAAITQALQAFGRSGVPLNIIYPSGTNSRPILLPAILTPHVVLEIIDNMSKAQ